MGRVEFSYSINLPQVVGSYADEHFNTFFVVFRHFLLILHVVDEKLLVDLGGDKIEDWDDVSGVVYNLAVKCLVKLEDVIAVNFEDWRLHLAHFFELLNILGGLCVSIIVVFIFVLFVLDESINEIFEFGLDLICVDISSPEDLGVRAHVCSALQLAIKKSG